MGDGGVIEFRLFHMFREWGFGCAFALEPGNDVMLMIMTVSFGFVTRR